MSKRIHGKEGRILISADPAMDPDRWVRVMDQLREHQDRVQEEFDDGRAQKPSPHLTQAEIVERSRMKLGLIESLKISDVDRDKIREQLSRELTEVRQKQEQVRQKQEASTQYVRRVGGCPARSDNELIGALCHRAGENLPGFDPATRRHELGSLTPEEEKRAREVWAGRLRHKVFMQESEDKLRDRNQVLVDREFEDWE
jgi:hypothetical protein